MEGSAQGPFAYEDLYQNPNFYQSLTLPASETCSLMAPIPEEVTHTSPNMYASFSTIALSSNNIPDLLSRHQTRVLSDTFSCCVVAVGRTLPSSKVPWIIPFSV